MVGEVLADRYELEELVGTGGMSSVFRAHDRLLDRKVALKILHLQYSGDDDYVERFKPRGALGRRAFASEHRHGHRPRRARGPPVHRLRVRRGREPEAADRAARPVRRCRTALELAIQIARGLAFAHQQGLIHRDVKPQNVLLNGDGRAKVTDFGIARSIDVQHGMTQTGTVLGTSDYIAPEQAQGQRVDEHTDVYSLGVVLYELLTSEVPFPGENFVAVAMRHINEEPPLGPRQAARRAARASTRRSSGRWRSGPRTASRRWTRSAPSSRRASPSCRRRGRSWRGPPSRRPRRQHRPRFSPWPLIARARRARRGGGGRRGAHPPQRRQRARRAVGAPAAPSSSARSRRTTRSAATASTTPTRRRRPTATRARTGRPRATARRRASARRASASSSTPAARSSSTSSRFTTSTPGLTAEILAGDSPGGPFNAVVGASQTVGWRSGRVHDRRRRAPLLRDLDHERLGAPTNRRLTE